MDSRQLTNSQSLSIKYIREHALTRKKEATTLIKEILQMSNIHWDTYESALSKLRSNARIALHFHPDRPLADTTCVAQGLLEQGTYKSQFETHISNGSPTAYLGGARDLWEKHLFHGAYHIDGAAIHERPKYGSLNVMSHVDGPSPRFGSCFFLLSPRVSWRSTFTYGDSYTDRPEKGTYEEFDMIMAALLNDTFSREFALGEEGLTPSKFIHRLLYDLDKPYPNPIHPMPRHNLDHYVEAQIHGEISLKDDVEILVADPSFKGTPIGSILERLCMNYSIKFIWNTGYYLKVEAVPTDFRGPTMPALARRIEKDGYINASIIGDAVNELNRNPANWSDRGSYAEVLQELKLLWHVLVRFGKPQGTD
ncbi:DUF3626 domain-containing protein [Paenibacillus sp. GCM10023250]|uniref:DUF3626 domain-containing protein n=1 Tax=Paenibacillus sp. GCM10023250 TaxID=3252648 RepID=UPI00361E9512